jgi:hypothetical protein
MYIRFLMFIFLTYIVKLEKNFFLNFSYQNHKSITSSTATFRVFPDRSFEKSTEHRALRFGLTYSSISNSPVIELKR